jgi:nicotinamidase-related amidase
MQPQKKQDDQMPLLNVSKTALFVMDFQNEIVDPKGAIGSHGLAEQVIQMNAIPTTAKVLAAARKAGMLVVHVTVAFRPGHPEIAEGSALFQGIKDAGALVEGSWGAEIHPDLTPVDGEVVVTKRGVSAFAGTDLELVLRNRGIDNVVLTGIATTFVIEGTARHAVDLGIPVIVLDDCCASMTGDMHMASLVVLGHLATLSNSGEFIAGLS